MKKRYVILNPISYKTMKFKEKEDTKNCLQTTSGFARAGVYARRHFCTDFQACRPPEPLRNSRLREAATTCARKQTAKFSGDFEAA